MIKISIIIPVYNVEPYIASCLKSVISQSYPYIECIIIDDCGTDRSIDMIRDILKNYQRKIEFKIVEHEKNRGLSAARNTGINEATGDYLYFLDSDDELPENSMKYLAEKILLYNHPDVIIGDYELIPAEHRKHLHINKEYLKKSDEIIYTFCKAKWYMMAWNKLVKTDFILKNQLYFKEGIIHEDNLWSFQLAIMCQNIVFVHKVTYLYRMRAGSIVNSQFTSKNIEGILSSLKYIDSVRNQLDNKYIHTYFETNAVGLVMKMYKKDFKEVNEYIKRMRSTLNLSLLSPIKRKDLKGILKLLVFHLPHIFIPIYLRLLFSLKK